MRSVTLYFNPEDRNDSRSLIEIIMARFGSSIKTHETIHGEQLYRIHDWVYVLAEANTDDRREPWYELKRKLVEQVVVYPVEFETIDEKDRVNGGVHQTDYCEEKLLYYITQYMRLTERVKAVKKYLADAGVFVDSIRRNPEVGFEATRDAYRMKGKDEVWIQTRIEGIVNRHRFTDVVKKAVRETVSSGELYGMITEELYIGLWRRTQEMLVAQMALPEKAKLRDHQSRLALLLEGVAEEVCAHHLGKEKDISLRWARAIVQEAADQVGQMAQQLSEQLGKDIPTDLPLEKGFEMPQIERRIGNEGGVPDDLETPRPQTPRLDYKF